MTKIHKFLGETLRLKQPAAGYLPGTDAVLLAASIDPSRGKHILDVGCGSGAVAICIKKRCPDADVSGLDHQAEMVQLAVDNALLNSLSINFFEQDFLGDLKKFYQSFDQIATNPPYYTDNAAASLIPQRALSRTFDTGSLALWIKNCRRLLKHRGYLTLIYPTQAVDTLIKILLHEKFGAIRLYPLWPKPDVPSKRILIQARVGVATPLTLLPGLMIQQPDGSPSLESEKILRYGQGINMGG